MAKINVELVAPFIVATIKTFRTMMNAEVERKKVAVKRGYVMVGDISGVIGMSGKVTGTCAISLPEEAAVRLVSKMLGEELDSQEDDQTVRDGVGEIINMITGDAKAALSETRYVFNITLPTIITGKGYEVYHRTGTRCVAVDFVTSEGEEFSLDITVPVEQ